MVSPRGIAARQNLPLSDSVVVDQPGPARAPALAPTTSSTRRLQPLPLPHASLPRSQARRTPPPHPFPTTTTTPPTPPPATGGVARGCADGRTQHADK